MIPKSNVLNYKIEFSELCALIYKTSITYYFILITLFCHWDKEK